MAETLSPTSPLSACSSQCTTASECSSLTSISTETEPSSPTFPTLINSTITQKTRLPWILHHILERQISSELPLRIMFSFNAGHQLPTLKEAHKWWQYDPKGRLIINFLSSLEKLTPSIDETSSKKLKKSRRGRADDFNPDNAPQDRFMDPYNDALLDIDFASSFPDDRRHSQGLPLPFIIDMCLNKTFVPKLTEVDFAQALTAMDYLRDLECTRRAHMRDVTHRLNIRKDNWRDVLSQDPDASKWVEDCQTMEMVIGDLYASAFIDLRIWTMIYELKSEPFYKPNVLAMLNTLFPPSFRELPNDSIDCGTLKKYRAMFYRFIVEIESKGVEVIYNFIKHINQPANKHSWAYTQENLADYIELASIMIEQASAVRDVTVFRRNAAVAYQVQKAKARKSDATIRASVSGSQKKESDKQMKIILPPLKISTAGHHGGMESACHQVQRSGAPSTTPPGTPAVAQHCGSLVDIRKNRKSSDFSHHPQDYFDIPIKSLKQVASSPFLRMSGTSFIDPLNSLSPTMKGRISVLYKNRALLRRATRPFKERNSEVARHPSFSRPITPLIASPITPSSATFGPKQHLDHLRGIVPARHTPPSNNQIAPSTPTQKKISANMRTPTQKPTATRVRLRLQPRGGTTERMASSTVGHAATKSNNPAAAYLARTPVLPSPTADFSFLNSPYEPPTASIASPVSPRAARKLADKLAFEKERARAIDNMQKLYQLGFMTYDEYREGAGNLENIDNDDSEDSDDTLRPTGSSTSLSQSYTSSKSSTDHESPHRSVRTKKVPPPIQTNHGSETVGLGIFTPNNLSNWLSEQCDVQHPSGSEAHEIRHRLKKQRSLGFLDKDETIIGIGTGIATPSAARPPPPKSAMKHRDTETSTTTLSQTPTQSQTPTSMSSRFFGFFPPTLKKQLSLASFPKSEESTTTLDRPKASQETSTSRKLVKTASFAEDTPNLPPKHEPLHRTLFMNPLFNLSGILTNGRNTPKTPKSPNDPGTTRPSAQQLGTKRNDVKAPLGPDKSSTKSRSGSIFQLRTKSAAAEAAPVPAPKPRKRGTSLSSIFRSNKDDTAEGKGNGSNPKKSISKHTRFKEPSPKRSDIKTRTNKSRKHLKSGQKSRAKSKTQRRKARAYRQQHRLRLIPSHMIHRPAPPHVEPEDPTDLPSLIPRMAFALENTSEYRGMEYQRQYLIEASRAMKMGKDIPEGGPWLKEKMVKKGMRYSANILGRDYRRRNFERWIMKGETWEPVKISERVDWSAEGWYEKPGGKWVIAKPVLKKRMDSIFVKSEKSERSESRERADAELEAKIEKQKAKERKLEQTRKMTNFVMIDPSKYYRRY